MKRLDLKNSFAEGMIFNVINALNIYCNWHIITIVFILILQLASISVFAADDTSTSGGKPYYLGGVWYSLYDSRTLKGNANTNKSDRCPYVYAPTNQDLDFKYWNNATAKTTFCKQVCLYENIGGSWTNLWNSGGFYKSTNQYYSAITGIPRCSKNIKQISIKYVYAYPSAGAYYSTSNFTITLAKHILFDNNTDFGTNNYAAKSVSANIGQAVPITIPFRSFYLNNSKISIKIRSGNGDPKVFRIEDQSESNALKTDGLAEITFTSAGACGVAGERGDYYGGNVRAGNASDKDIVVWFYPTSTSEETAIFDVYDGENTGTAVASFTVKGTGTKETLEFGEVEIDQESEIKEFTMTNFVSATCTSGTGTVSLAAPSDDYWFSTDDGATWVQTETTMAVSGTASKKFQVKFKPNDANPTDKSGDITITECNGQQYKVHVTATAKKIPLTVTWKESGDFVMEVDEYRSDFLENSESESLDLQPIFTLTNQTYVEYGTGEYLGALHANTATPSGTKVGLTVAFPTTITERYAITAPTSGATIQVTSLQRKFIKWDVSLEYLRYESGSTQHTSADIPLAAIVVDKDGAQITGQTITYIYTTVDGTPMSKNGTVLQNGATLSSGDVLQVTGIGEAKLTINSPGNSTYFEAEAERRIVVSEYTASCYEVGLALKYTDSWKEKIYKQSETTISTNKVDNKPVPAYYVSVGWRLSGTILGATAELRVHANDANGDQLCTTGGMTGKQSDTLTCTIPAKYRDNLNALYLKVVKSGTADLSNDMEVTPIKITQASYFEKPDNSITTIPFGQCEVDKTSKKNVTVKFSALHESIHAVITGTDAAYFTVEEYTSTNGCADFGTKTIEVKFKPMSVGYNYSATLHLYGYTDASETVPVELTYDLSGSGQKRNEYIVWDENSQKLTDEYDNRGTLIELIAEPSVSPLAEETGWCDMQYESDDTNVATVAKDNTDGKWYLTMVNAGEANITAKHCGGSCTNPAPNKSLKFTVAQSTPDITITANPLKPNVFGTSTITAESTKSAGTITLDVISTYNGGTKNGSIQTTSQIAGKSVGTLTVATRACENTGQKEGDIVVRASIGNTPNYKAHSVTYTVEAQKVSTTIVWSNTSTELSGTRKVGDVVQLSAYIDETTALKVEYTSSNTSLATVDNNTGKMTCVAPGIVKITAKQTTGNCDCASTTQTISYLFLISPADFGEVNITGTKQASFTISTGETGDFEFAASDDGEFFFSKNDNTYGWEDKSLTSVSDGNIVYIKFQPYTAGENSKTFKVTHNSIEYDGALTGTGKTITASLSTNITQGNHYGWSTDTPLPDDFFRSSTDQYSVSLSGDPEFLIQRETGDDGSFERQKTNIARGISYRVGHFPKNTSQKQVTVTVKDNHYNISYSYILQGTGVLLEHGFGSVEVGKGSAAWPITMSYFDISNNLTVTAPNNHFLLSANGTSDWKTSLNLTSTRATFYVHYAPENSNVSQHSGDIEIKDNNSSSTEKYKYHVTGTPTKSEIAFPDCEIDDNQTPLPFTMTNFICEGNVEVTPPANFVISSSENGPFQSTKLTIGAKGTFYVKLASTATIYNYTGDVTMVDKKTGHTYSVSLKSNVTLKHSTISFSNDRIYLFPGDVNVHEMVGDGYIVHGSPKEIEPSIMLSVPTDKAQYLEVKDNQKLQLQTGFTLTGNEDVTVTASFTGNTRCAAATSKTFTARIVDTTNLDSRAWVKDGNKWYVFKYTDLDLCHLTALIDSGEYNYNISIYLPNVACNKQYFAVRNGIGWTPEACPFSTLLLCSDEQRKIAYLNGVTTQDYNTEGNHTTINLPARGDDAHLYTYTNRYDNPECGEILGNVPMKHAKIEIELPPHYHLLKSSENVNFGEVQVGEVAYKDVKLNGANGLFKSFLTTNGLTLSGSPAGFFINPDNESQSSRTLVPANYVLSPYNKIDSYDGLVVDKDGNYYIRIYFKPLVDEQVYRGSYTLSDGDMSLTINVTGKGLVTENEPQYIMWNDDLSRLVGSGSKGLTASSNSGATVSYSPGITGLSVSGSTLTYSGDATTTITANCAAGTYNGVKYYAPTTPVEKVATVTPTAPTPGACGADAINNPRAWRKNYRSSPFTMTATQGFTWNGTGTITRIDFDITLENCSIATVKLYANGTNESNKIGEYSDAGTKSITGLSLASGSTFYCYFNGVAGEDGNARVSLSVTNIKVYYSPIPQQITTGPVNFGSQRIGQVGITKNIQVIKFSGMSGILSASIISDGSANNDVDCFTLVTDKNPAVINTACEETVATYDVRFVPKREGSLSAILRVTDPLGQSHDITLTGTGVKRNLAIKWDDISDKTIYTAGLTEAEMCVSFKPETVPYAYDALRGEAARTSLVKYYVSGDDVVELLYNDDGTLSKIKAKGVNTGEVTITAYVDGNDLFNAITTTESDKKMKVTVERGTMHLVGCNSDCNRCNTSNSSTTNSNGELLWNWACPDNWSIPELVTTFEDIENYHVQIDVPSYVDEYIENNVVVPARCCNLGFGDNGKLKVEPKGVLVASGEIVNDAAEKFILNADANNSATVIFGNGSPKATVYMWIRKGNGSKTDPEWQYRGICVKDFEAITSIDKNGVTYHPWNCMYIFKWYEYDNNNLEHGCWIEGFYGSDIASHQLQPWTGYAFANLCSNDADGYGVLPYKGTLLKYTEKVGEEEKAQHTVDLTRHEVARPETAGGRNYENCGVNLITNSYTAPVKIDGVHFGDNTQATVTFFNSGSYSDWYDHHSQKSSGYANAGQMTVCPSETGEEAQEVTHIPAGQAFFVTATADGAKLTLPYPGTLSELPSGKMFLPSQDEPIFNMLGIRVELDSTKSDRLVLIECDSCSRQYDNGYDGYKKKGNKELPQLYAYNKFGNTAVNADSTFNKQYIGFSAGSDDETYTISFETDRLFGYHSLYLVDRKLNESVDILAGETYSFKGYTVGENTRFQINGVTIEEWEKENEGGDNDDDNDVCDLRVVGNTLFVEGFTTSRYPAARIEIFDMTGNMVWSTALTDSRVYDLPALPQGVYTIRLGDCHVKYGVR